jgi:alkane 1-monooxygenase
MLTKGYTGTLDNGEAIFYQDRKRWFWLMSVLYPLMPFLGIWLHAAAGNQVWLLFPLAINYIGGPVTDWLIGADTNNPPDAVVTPRGVRLPRLFGPLQGGSRRSLNLGKEAGF